MSVTNINSKVVQAAIDKLDASGKLDITTKIPHAGGGHFIVGERYEMYAPAASGSAENLGILWSDSVGYSFEFAGVTHIMEELYICTKDIHYGGKAIPDIVAEAFVSLRAMLGGVSPLCPTYVGLKLIRPATEC